jgi:hypothetical protein
MVQCGNAPLTLPISRVSLTALPELAPQTIPAVPNQAFKS